MVGNSVLVNEIERLSACACKLVAKIGHFPSLAEIEAVDIRDNECFYDGLEGLLHEIPTLIGNLAAARDREAWLCLAAANQEAVQLQDCDLWASSWVELVYFTALRIQRSLSAAAGSTEGHTNSSNWRLLSDAPNQRNAAIDLRLLLADWESVRVRLSALPSIDFGRLRIELKKESMRACEGLCASAVELREVIAVPPRPNLTATEKSVLTLLVTKNRRLNNGEIFNDFPDESESTITKAINVLTRFNLLQNSRSQGGYAVTDYGREVAKYAIMAQ